MTKPPIVVRPKTGQPKADQPDAQNSQPNVELTASEIAELTKIQKLQRFSKGTVLLRAGELITHFYSVIEGCIRTYNLHDDEEFTLDFYTEGQSVLPAVATEGAISPCFIVCEEDCLLNIADEKMEKEVFERLPRLKELCRINSERLLIESQREMAIQKSFSPQQRYEHLLKTRPNLVGRVPQYQIASYLGIKPESLSRLRKRMLNR